ncbi:MAG: MFS transporter [Cryobacterium sp.]
MILRRIFYYWQFIAVGALPLWLIVGSSLFGEGGWEVLGVTLGAIALGVALLAVALLIFARKEVREAKAVSWPDVGVLALWHALVVGVGFYAAASPWLSALAVVVGIGAFWFAIWELFDAARRRVRDVFEYIETTAAGPGIRLTETTFRDADARSARPADPNVIIIPEKPDGKSTRN